MSQMQWRADAAIPSDLCRILTDERRTARRLRAVLVVYPRQGKGIRDFYTTEKTRREHESILVGSYGRTGGMNVPRRKT